MNIYLSCSPNLSLLSLCTFNPPSLRSTHTHTHSTIALQHTHSAAMRWPQRRTLWSGWTMTPICVILSEANIGTVPCLFNTCLTRLMTSVLAINIVVLAHTHTNKHTHTHTSACRANEWLPAARAVIVVEGDNVNINWPVIAVACWEDTHNRKVVADSERQRF